MASGAKNFEQFYTQHFGKVFRFVFFRCNGDRALAEDLVSEIFLKALNHFAAYDEARSRSAWIMTITRHHLANFWRDRKPTVALDAFGGSEAEGEGTPAEPWSVATSRLAQEQKAATLEAQEFLAKLAPNEREIVTLHYLAGYSYAEIAELVGSTAGAVKVAAHRAIKRLRDFL
ncbi:MAG: RNA polymerase sigma factor [Candidatus Magasanikbacteria bacterium]|nr:RNA polymerase sigma factor [Candidatus Magasanikbacteria bacterium]